MKYVMSEYGDLWLFNERNYAALVGMIKTDTPYDLEDLGVRLTDRVHLIGDIKARVKVNEALHANEG